MEIRGVNAPIDFNPLHDWMRENESTGTVFTPGDVEGMWMECFEEETGLTFEEVWPNIRDSWEWQKGIRESLCEHGFELIDYMLTGFCAEKNLLRVQRERGEQ